MTTTPPNHQIYAPHSLRGILHRLADLEPDINSPEPDPEDLDPYAEIARKNFAVDEDSCLLPRGRCLY